MVDMVGTRTISGVRASKALNTGNQVKGIVMLLMLMCVCVWPIVALTEQLYAPDLPTSSLSD